MVGKTGLGILEIHPLYDRIKIHLNQLKVVVEDEAPAFATAPFS
jgi:hypothetical protein